MGDSAKKILFVNAEMYPYLPETRLAKVCRELPQGIQERKKEIRAFMPRYGCINERKNQLHEVIRLSGMNIIISDVDRPLVIKVASISAARIQVYFIDNEDYFRRKQIDRDEKGHFFADNGERAILCPRRAGDGEEAALGPGHHPLQRMDFPRASALPQESLQGRPYLLQFEGGALPV
jgi:starch synthase